MPRKQTKAKARAAEEPAPSSEVASSEPSVDLSMKSIMRDPFAVVQALLFERRYFVLVAGLLLLFNLLLGAAIVLHVSC
jgi:hypothetical protein